jgi:hypothetical protein
MTQEQMEKLIKQRNILPTMILHTNSINIVIGVIEKSREQQHIQTMVAGLVGQLPRVQHVQPKVQNIEIVVCVGINKRNPSLKIKTTIVGVLG